MCEAFDDIVGDATGTLSAAWMAEAIVTARTCNTVAWRVSVRDDNVGMVTAVGEGGEACVGLGSASKGFPDAGAVALPAGVTEGLGGAGDEAVVAAQVFLGRPWGGGDVLVLVREV